MPPPCPHCGFRSCDEAPRFCSNCGARMDGTPPAWYPGPGTATAPGFPAAPPPGYEPKSPLVAGLCSTVLPGLGQVYNGETAKGFLLFLLTFAGLLLLLLPGLLAWLYAMYDAYAVAGRMNAGAVPYRPMNAAHMVIFIAVAVIVVIAAVLLVLALVAGVMGDLGSLGLGTGTRGAPANAFANLF